VTWPDNSAGQTGTPIGTLKGAPATALAAYGDPRTGTPVETESWVAYLPGMSLSLK